MGYTDADMEVALDPGLEVRFVKRFATDYKHSLSEHDLLRSHLLSRLRRDINKGKPHLGPCQVSRLSKGVRPLRG